MEEAHGLLSLDPLFLDSKHLEQQLKFGREMCGVAAWRLFGVVGFKECKKGGASRLPRCFLADPGRHEISKKLVVWLWRWEGQVGLG